MFSSHCGSQLQYLYDSEMIFVYLILVFNLTSCASDICEMFPGLKSSIFECSLFRNQKELLKLGAQWMEVTLKRKKV